MDAIFYTVLASVISHNKMYTLLLGVLLYSELIL